MTVEQLKKELDKFPGNFPVIRSCGTDYEDYCEISQPKLCRKYESMCGIKVEYEGKVREGKIPNAIILW